MHPSPVPPRPGSRTLPAAERPQPALVFPAERCAYCIEHPPTVLCGPEHTAYAGEWLCVCCYAELFEGPVLFAS